jgi:hypothetical protein
VPVMPVHGEHYEYLIALGFSYIPPGSYHRYLIALYSSPLVYVSLLPVYGEHYEYSIAMFRLYPSQIAIINI